MSRRDGCLAALDRDFKAVVQRLRNNKLEALAGVLRFSLSTNGEATETAAGQRRLSANSKPAASALSACIRGPTSD
jgi:hypothetical protein